MCKRTNTKSFIQDPLGYLKAFLRTSTITLRLGAFFWQINDLSCKSKPAVVCWKGKGGWCTLRDSRLWDKFLVHLWRLYALRTFEVNDGTWLMLETLHSLNLARSMRFSEMQCCICKNLRVWFRKVKGSPKLDPSLQTGVWSAASWEKVFWPFVG